jgi:hypothetical protein
MNCLISQTGATKDTHSTLSSTLLARGILGWYGNIPNIQA